VQLIKRLEAGLMPLRSPAINGQSTV